TNSHTDRHTQTHMQTYRHTHTNTLTYAHTDTHTLEQTNTYLRIQTLTHTHTHTVGAAFKFIALLMTYSFLYICIGKCAPSAGGEGAVLLVCTLCRWCGCCLISVHPLQVVKGDVLLVCIL